MLRVIGGSLSARQFESPPGQGAHPMSDRIRGALFNSLGDISGLRVLDAFGGSGALSFEALSRGAMSSTICENEPKVAAAIARSVEQLGLKGSVQLIKGSVYGWLRDTQDQFDIVFADPPYDAFVEHRLENFLAVLKPSALLIVSYPSNLQTPELRDASLLQQKTYGNAALAFYRKTD